MPNLFKRLPLASLLCLALGCGVIEESEAAAPPKAEIKTNLGSFVIELYPDKAPKTVANFIQYVDEGFYAGTTFHRVIPNFMVQGGGHLANLDRKPTRAPIEIESRNGLKNDAGWVAMARTSSPNSASSQFFINVVNNDGLNHPNPDGHGYTVFGKVVSGMDVVEKIRKSPTGSSGGMRDVPTTAIVIESAKMLKP
ncbi:MAG: peptidyl-prolyl cis-trans isomerase [Betaproteobacteria bacterium]|nr:peptidyl-prolyl cis-trans isomerase [Pseudomonadota bacterium]NBO04993.1 peptidyl-prolyl cis-trans isomerase [Betaproteobacteria bacterium]HAB47294.1 peptidylprolyl isomerase [Lautropia sp.]NBO94318.1 peptidyl-prolyl cis-trans isomerase [Betaproteobacteria bacterium]NBP34224.1 peptidyl-prolyl cis-trans isomerase [Betaproteobacteria bacterium]